MNTINNIIKFKKSLPVMNDLDPIAMEQYRILYTKIDQISLLHSYKTFAITSAIPGEGKTTTSLNFAYVMAQEFKKKVILIESDLRRPCLLSHFLTINLRHDFVEVLREKVDYKAAIIKVGNSDLYIMPTVNKTNTSSQLLGTPVMKNMLEILKTNFDYIILDSPPILAIADMNIISKIVDGVILVVRAGKTPKSIVQKAVDSLDNINIMGIILNSTDTLLSKYNYNYSYYY